jgi:propionate CoA-transferase
VLDTERAVLYIDFAGLQVNAPSLIAQIDTAVRERLAPFATATGRRVDVVVNYDHFGIAPELLDAYTAVVRGLAADFYGAVTRYGTTGFLKARL